MNLDALVRDTVHNMIIPVVRSASDQRAMPDPGMEQLGQDLLERCADILALLDKKGTQ